MKTYRLQEAADLLGVTPSSLYLWIRKAGMMSALKRQRAPYDMRVHYLTEEQLQALARAHNRVIGGKPDPVQALQAEIAAQQARIATLEAALNIKPGEETTPGGQ